MADLKTWGLPRLGQLLPLDEESLSQIIDYSASLPVDACADHLKNLLGDSPAALEFIASFNNRRSPQSPAPAARNDVSSSYRDRPRGKIKKEKKSIHSTGPPRLPENYGDVTGGYKKSDREEDYMSTSKSATATALSLAPAATATSSSGNSRAHSPVPPVSSKAPPSAAGSVLSDMLPNVRSKAGKPNRNTGSNANSKNSGTLTTSNISDLTAAIAALEVSTNPTLDTEKRKCTCYASIHPLFTPAPNCLNCGKIICALEGLQPCSFCGTPLLSAEEVQSMIRELRAERGQEKMRAHNDSVHHDHGPRPTGSDSKLDAAKAHRDKLLRFQAQNARRTKVVDEAADFETPNVASTIWMSPAQRALALKKQQRIQREMEEKARPEWEKKKTVMSLDIKGGKVRRVYQSAAVEPSGAPDDQADAADEAEPEKSSKGGQALSHNPLLAAGGLVRPIWRAPEGKEGQPHERTERKQTWRRVQDDNDDNEQWILDGGLHGYSS